MSRRLALVITDLDYGGAEKQVCEMAVRLHGRGWEVLLVSLLPPRALTDELEQRGVRWASLGMRRGAPDPRGLVRLVRLFRDFGPDVVHSHMIHANFLARAARLVGYRGPLVCTAHSVDEGQGAFRRLTYRYTDGLCDVTTNVSRPAVDRYLAQRLVSPKRIQCMPNGIDTSLFAPNREGGAALRQELELGDGFVWVCVAGFRPEKNHAGLLRAFAEVVSTCPETTLLLVGDGELRGASEALAADLGISQSVRFVGLQRDVPRWLNAADGYVMASDFEGLPLVLLEAQAAGLPVVATDVGGNPELVREGVTGFLVPPQDSNALAGAMLRMQQLPPEAREAMGRAGRERVVRTYDIENVLDRWEALYQELMAAHSRRRGG